MLDLSYKGCHLIPDCLQLRVSRTHLFEPFHAPHQQVESFPHRLSLIPSRAGEEVDPEYRIVEDFRGKGPQYTPGHEEIEIALLRLHGAVEGDTAYLEMARQLIERRGRTRLFPLSILRQNASVEKRSKHVKLKRQEYLAEHSEHKPYELPPGNVATKPGNSMLRWYASALSGKYFQQHAPVRKQKVPVGHAVRFGYLETAVAKLCRENGDASLLPALEQAWERMVTRRMYVTGGVGSLAGLEGFGNDYELDPEYAYAETCAALAGMFWNWEMLQLTGKPKYSDLFEWQLYNAAAVGMGLDGTSYLYNNPLACRGGVTRKPWYAVPCCPSNLSRTWAELGKLLVRVRNEALFEEWGHETFEGYCLKELHIRLAAEAAEATKDLPHTLDPREIVPKDR